MAEQDTGQERTEQPTPKRIEDARKKGQVLRSRELNTLIMMIGASVALYVFGEHLAQRTLQMMASLLSLERAHAYDKLMAVRQIMNAGEGLLIAQIPLFVLMAIAVFLGPSIVGGIHAGEQLIRFKPEQLDPIKGLGRIFSLNSLIELLKSLVKVAWLSLIAVLVGGTLYPDLLSLGALPVAQGIKDSTHILLISMFALTLALLPIAALDIPHQVWEYFKKLRMTRQEVKDEMKELEGAPELKARVRQQQRAMAQRRMMDEVPTADVVITNPTHFAVALRYEASGSGAPSVVAKGKGELSAKIRELASMHGVVLFRAPPLARALYFSTELGQQIPAGLYVAVARVLAYVYQLRASAGQYSQPNPPTDLPVPDELARRAPS